jgi:polyhydroxyalkanoate synthase subunit PhaC
MNVIERLARAPVAALEFANILLTQGDATIGATPKDVVWTHRKTSLYRYRSDKRRHPIPVLLVFALINRPDIFDLRPGSSFVEFLLEEGFDVFLIDWGYPEEEDADVGLEDYVCGELASGIREVLRSSGADELSLLGWCIGGTLCLLYGGTHPDSPVRNMLLLTTPVDTRGSLYEKWVGRESFDVDYIAEGYKAVPGPAIDWANKLMKPVTNYWTTYRQLWEAVLEGQPRREAYQAMARWIADNPPFPARAYREWITWMYKENRLVSGNLRLGRQLVELRRIDQSLLVVTAGADHIAPPQGTHPLLGMVSSEDVTRYDRRGGHIGLMAGSKARNEIWPDIAQWLRERSDNQRRGSNGNSRDSSARAAGRRRGADGPRGARNGRNARDRRRNQPQPRHPGRGGRGGVQP